MIMGASADAVAATPKAQASTKERDEEWKHLALVATLLGTVMCCICLSMGGVEALATWVAPTANGCSVADLGKLEGSHGRFHCTDGFVDLSQEMTLAEKGTSPMETYAHLYRIAPVYT